MIPKRKNAVRLNIPIVKSDVPYRGTNKPVLLVSQKIRYVIFDVNSSLKLEFCTASNSGVKKYIKKIVRNSQ